MKKGGPFSRTKSIQVHLSEREYNIIRHYANENTCGNLSQWLRIAALKYEMPADKRRNFYEVDKLKHPPQVRM